MTSNRYFFLMLLVAASVVRLNALAAGAKDDLTLSSPNSQVQVRSELDAAGRITFQALFRNSIVASGKLGLSLLNAPPLKEGFELIGTHRESRNVTYAIPVGKASQAEDHHHELILSLQEKNVPRRRVDIVLRAFNDGIAFRYQLPKQEALRDFIVTQELTQFTFADDPIAHLLPLNSFTSSYEKHYLNQRVSAIKDASLIGLPLLLEYQSANRGPVWMAITEAELTNYAGMYLAPEPSSRSTMSAKLSPLPNRKDGAAVVGKTPFASPWRVLQIADKPGNLLESNIVFNLSESSRIGDTSWIKPGRTTFPWWNGYVLEGVDFEPGLNTATHKHYIDFCAEQGIEYHSLDGTDTAWYGGPIIPNGPTDITKAVPEIDLPELLRYAKEKGVRLRLWMHWKALQAQLDDALAKYEEWGIEGIMIDFMDRDDQEMVAFYHEVAEKAAQHHLTVNWHGAYKPTGMERTWPNVFNYEAALNQEYNKWDRIGTPPRHNLDIAFIRMLAGPVDYHLGGMRNVLPKDFKPRDKAPIVQGTRGHQLALYVILQNPLPMLVDYPAAYRGQPGLDFLCQVPTNWDETRVLQADFGKCLVIARRRGKDWYVGGIAADDPIELALTPSFLSDGKYELTRYMDGKSGPTSLATSKQEVTAKVALHLSLPAGGGFVATLKPTK